MLRFFNDNFGRFLVAQTGDAEADAQRALSSGHALRKGGHPQRISSGWAIVRTGRSTMQLALAAEGIEYSRQERSEAFAEELRKWDGSPRIFIVFKNKPVPVGMLFLTYDLRAVRICSPGGVQSFDATVPPEDDFYPAHRQIWNLLGGGK